MPLETEATAALRALIAGLRADDADLLEALHRVQHHFGYVSAEAMHVIADQLRVTPAHVYGVTTYYADFRTTPPPQTMAKSRGSWPRWTLMTRMARAMLAVTTEMMPWAVALQMNRVLKPGGIAFIATHQPGRTAAFRREPRGLCRFVRSGTARELPVLGSRCP